jgi:hypothetical protein
MAHQALKMLCPHCSSWGYHKVTKTYPEYHFIPDPDEPDSQRLADGLRRRTSGANAAAGHLTR